MKVLYITNYDTMYGANKSLFTMMTLLQEKYGVEPYLLVPGVEGGVIGRLCSKHNIPLFTYDFRISAIDEKTKFKTIRKCTRRCMRYVDFYKILHRINQLGIDFKLVHSNSSIFDIGYFLSRRWGIPHVWHIREFAKKDYDLEMVSSSWSIRKKYIKSDAIIAISGSIYEYITQIDKKIPLKLIYNGINIPKEYCKVYSVDGLVNFCIVGSINRRKNVIDIIMACHKLYLQNIKNYRLYVVGDNEGEYYQELQQYIKENPGIRENILFTGYCEDVNAFLKKMDVGIMASDAEAFGRVTVEYMANYMAVIGTNTGGTPEVVGVKDDLYMPHDIQCLAELMRKYIENTDLLVEAGNRNRMQAEKFTADRNAEEVYKIYMSICE